MRFLDHVWGYASDAFDLIQKDSLKDKLKAIKKLAHMIHMIRSSESQCEVLDADWDSINQMSEAWRAPKDIKFEDGTLYVHGVDIGE